jgi:hypothetical protein
MGAALIIVILVGAGESADASTRAVQPALEEAARRPVTTSVRETAHVPDEAEAAWIAADAKVDVVAEVGWTGPAHEHAVVHLHGRDGRILRASDLEFSNAEPRAERGRAIGFAIATMLADEPVAAGILASTAAAESSTRTVIHTAPVPAAAAPAPEPTTPPDVPATHPPDRAGAGDADHPRFAIEAAGAASSDVRTGAVGAGPLVRLQWNVARDVGLRAGGAARWFTAGSTSASELGAMSGVLWTFARGALVAAALRAEVGVVHDAFTEEVFVTNPRGMVLPGRVVDRSSWAPAFLAGIEGDWRPGRATALFVALNVEASTRTIAAETQTMPSAVWASLEGGVRFSF